MLNPNSLTLPHNSLRMSYDSVILSGISLRAINDSMSASDNLSTPNLSAKNSKEIYPRQSAKSAPVRRGGISAFQSNSQLQRLQHLSPIPPAHLHKIQPGTPLNGKSKQG